MTRSKAQKDRSHGKLIVGAFAIAIVVAIGWVMISQSGVIPGDVPTQQDGVGPGTIPDTP